MEIRGDFYLDSEEFIIMTIGIIEDDRLLNQALNKFLTDNGYDTVCAHSGEEAFAAATDHPDLWLIDIGLSDGNGLDLYRELTAVRKVPAVFLTARDEERDMLRAFDMGAEDYVVKPFSMKVLLKRIERILKTNREGRMLTCGDITLYREKKQVFSGDEEIALTAKEYQLLELFMENQDQVLTKENILDRIWGIDGAFIEENTVSVTISRLKKKLVKNQFDFNDFLTQISQIKKMGNLKDLAGMIPGVGKMLKNVEINDDVFKQTEAIIHSMTPAERADPSIINGSRRQRIATGSGTTMQDVNRLLKQFEDTRKVMKSVAGGMPKMPKGFNPRGFKR